MPWRLQRADRVGIVRAESSPTVWSSVITTITFGRGCGAARPAAPRGEAAGPREADGEQRGGGEREPGGSAGHGWEVSRPTWRED